MALPDVLIQLLNGQLGSLLALADGVAGYVCEGASNGDIVLGTPFKVTGLDDAVAKGLTSATNAAGYKIVKEHYDEAPSGSEVYMMVVADTMTVDLMADKTNTNGARKLLDFAQGKIRLLGLMDSADSPTVTNGLDANVATAKTNLQALAEEYAGAGKQSPFWGFIGGTGYNGTATDLTDQTASDQDRVSIMVGDTASGTSAAIGTLLGRLAAIPVQRKPSRVKTGSLNITTAYVGTTKVEESTDIATIHDRGYITLRTFPNKNGYYFANDFTCTATTSDYHNGARRRVIDKVQIIAYALLVEEIEEEVPTEADGTIDAAYAAYLQDKINNQVRGIMVATNELSAFECFVDPKQQVLSDSTLDVVLRPTPVGYNSTINATLGFINPAA